MKIKPIGCSLLVLLINHSIACGFNRKNITEKNGHDDSQKDSIMSLQITPEDWMIESSQRGKTEVTMKILKADKLEFIRKNFRVPTLTPITVPESNGFELYQIKGYLELENAIYVHPKTYLNTGNGQGQVMGYRVGKKDPAGKDLIEISLPVALVNGLVPHIPSIGGVQEGPGAAVALPAKYQIPDLIALKNRIGGTREISTLPVCPKMFRLTFQDREYWAKSPFENLSNCPLNQFFRITFQAPVSEMQKLLETAAVRDEAVSMITELEVLFNVPSQSVTVSFDPDEFLQELKSELKTISPSGKDLADHDGFSIQDIERVMVNSIFNLSKKANLDPRYSASMVSAINPLIANYFSPPYSCASSETCRSLLGRPMQKSPITLSWMVTESLAASLESETVTALGAVANSSLFMAKPSTDELSLVRRPKYFKGQKIGDIIQECRILQEASYVFNPESTPERKLYFKSYCDEMVAHGIPAGGDENQTDGYVPLGSNTVVYPGAWLKIDIDSISEFTTAKTRTLADGRVVIESEVLDLLGLDPSAKRTQCLEGSSIACVEYRTKKIPVRSTSGDQMISNDPCKKGEPGCICERKTQPDGSQGEENCTHKSYLFQEVMDSSCDPTDEFEYCPYWRNEEEVVDYKREWECQSVKVGSKTTFLCFGGCSENWEVQCQEKSKEPIKAIRQKLNCKEDDPFGSASREKICRAPKNKCKRWSVACTKYTVNESFQIVHEDVTSKWRPFAIQKGEYPKRFEEDIYLKFVSPGKVVSGCRLNRFAREFRGNSIYIKMPSEKNEGLQPCDQPLWDERNIQSLYLPKVYIKNAISYPERRLCGRTEYSFTTKEIPLSNDDGLVPPQFAFKTDSRIGPIRETCLAEDPFQIGSDLWFTEYPAVQFSGRVSVLGRVLESIVTEVKP